MATAYVGFRLTTRVNKPRCQETLPAYSYKYVCQRQKLTAADAQDARCVVGADSTAAPRALLWGDSNAAHYIGMFGAFANQDGYRFRNLAVGSCPPIFGDPKAFVSAQRLHDCRDSSAVARQAINDFKTVVISANWLSYQNHADQFLDTFFDTVKTIENEGRRVILIGKAPVFDHYDRRCQEKALNYPLLTCPAFTSPLTEDVARALVDVPGFYVPAYRGRCAC